MFSNKNYLSCLLMLLLLGSATPGQAAEQNYSTPLPPPAKIETPSNPMTAQDVVRNNLQKLKTNLALTEAQQPLWDKFEANLEETSNSLSQELKSYAEATAQNNHEVPSLPKFLERRDALMEKRLQSNKKTREALGPLYHSLNKDQKRTMDKDGMILLGMFL